MRIYDTCRIKYAFNTLHKIRIKRTVYFTYLMRIVDLPIISQSTCILYVTLNTYYKNKKYALFTYNLIQKIT